MNLEYTLDWGYKKAIFRYGMPCVAQRLILGTISQGKYDELFSYMGKEEGIPEALLAEHFGMVLENIKGETGKDVDEYFVGRHNEKLENREGKYAGYPDKFLEHCMARNASVVKKLDGGEYAVKAEDYGAVKVFSDYVSEKFEVGDKVRIHRGHIVKGLE